MFIYLGYDIHFRKLCTNQFVKFVYFFTLHLEKNSTELEAQMESNTIPQNETLREKDQSVLKAKNDNLEEMNVSLNERLQEMKSEFDIQDNIISVYESQIKGIIF